MSRSFRKCSLDELSHKNRNQILYYVSQAKVQIYSHCMISYNPASQPISSHSRNIISDIYSDGLSKLCQRNILNQQKQHQILSISQKISLSNVFSSQGCQDQCTSSETPSNAQQSPTKNSSFSENIQSIQSSNEQKVIYFNNPDVAFYVNAEAKIIQIYSLATRTVQIVFEVHDYQTLLIVQTILRKKLCELGFYQKYKIIKLLGKGATAEVHLVERISDKKNFAAKIISTLNSNEKQFELFVNQAKLLRILKHKNIIHLESVYIHKSELIQLLEYVPGGTLLELLKKKQVKTSNQRWAVLRDITNGLQYLRQRRIVHRDLKLQNIMVRTSSKARQYIITDFGLACWSGQKSPLYQKCGTPGYIAPQILRMPAKYLLLDHRIDIFSLGVIAHIVFLREPLFHFQGCIKNLIQQNKKGQYDLYDKKYSQLSSCQSNFLLLTLQKKLQDRATADQLLRIVQSMTNNQQKKSPQKAKRKLSFDGDTPKIEVQVKKQACLKKKAIKIDIQCANKQRLKKQKQSDDSSPQIRSVISSARKAISTLWDSISPTHKRDQRLKLKQNSVQKHRKYSDFIHE